MGRITGSASIETLVRVGLEKEHGLSPDSKMIVLHDFLPCVDDELEVYRGQIVNVLYQENDWVYVISENQQQEGFIPFSYCASYEAPSYKKKMPRSGPGSVVSSGFNEMAVDAVTDVSSIIKPTSSCVDSFKYSANIETNNNFSMAPINTVDLPKIVPNTEFANHYHRSNYSPSSSMPLDSISPKHSYNSTLNMDRASTTPNFTNLHTATGPSTAAPSIVSACSNGVRSNLSSNQNSNKISLSFKKTFSKNAMPNQNLLNETSQYSAYPKNSLMQNMDYFGNALHSVKISYFIASQSDRPCQFNANLFIL